MTQKLNLVWALLIALLFSSCGYNKMVELDETAIEKWNNVESQYQRRSDLIPNLVSTVKGYASHEQETLEGVMKARASATQVTVDPTKLTPATIKAYQAAQGEISQSLGRLLAVSERYPDLKANQNFLELQAQLEGTENRITVARDRFNEAVKDYNVKIKSFPGVVYAGWFGFEKKEGFAAEAGSEKAPQVQF